MKLLFTCNVDLIMLFHVQYIIPDSHCNEDLYIRLYCKVK